MGGAIYRGTRSLGRCPRAGQCVSRWQGAAPYLQLDAWGTAEATLMGGMGGTAQKIKPFDGWSCPFLVGDLTANDAFN